MKDEMQVIKYVEVGYYNQHDLEFTTIRAITHPSNEFSDDYAIMTAADQVAEKAWCNRVLWGEVVEVEMV